MRADAVLKWLMPKEERFHELLAKDTANLVRGARVFVEIASSGSLEERRVRHVGLKAIEHDGDGITRQVFDALNSTFITPFDREDIRELTTNLDDILDYLEAVAQNLVLFELAESPEALRQFADILLAMAQEIDGMTALIWDMANERRIQEAIVRVSDLENQADRLYGTVIADLFKGNGRNPLEILKWKEVYEGLEDACDECKDFTHAVGNVLVKNS